MSTEALLNERQKTHGEFSDNARISQALKNLYRSEASWMAMTAIQQEALDMIACKLARILSGQGGFADHWADVAGYSQLAAREAQK